ncbi:MAG: methylmalonyl-CoA mutase, partial [Candidatus Thorarchaeota archaeon]
MVDKSGKLASAKENWEKNTLRPHQATHPDRRKEFVTTSSKPVKVLYTPLDIPDFDYMKDLGFPSEYPYTRGVQPSMHRGKLWTMRQFAGMGSAEETNERFKFLLANGLTGLSVAFHLPTLFARDSDHPFSHGEVGKLGVAVDTLKDMETLFNGIPLDQVTTSMTINAPASILLAMYMVAAEKQGVSPDKIGGTIQNDLLKEYMAQKSWILAPKPSLRIIGDIMEYATKHIPRWNTISISGYHIREAGSTAAQELAFTLLNGMQYVKVGIKQGLDVDAFAPRLSFFFNAHNDIFEEVAKYRAARRIWAREMKETFGAKKERSLWMRFHTQTAGCSLTAQQPMVNVVRTAYQALAAVLGGTQSLHTNSMDEALCLPTEDAVRVALRTQQVLAHESGAANTIDPLAGSY